MSHPTSRRAHAAGCGPRSKWPLSCRQQPRLLSPCPHTVWTCASFSLVGPDPGTGGMRAKKKMLGGTDVLLGPQALWADSSNPCALCMESGLIRLVFLPVLAAALTTTDQWVCLDAHQQKNDTGEPLCQPPLAGAEVDSSLADKSSPPSKLPLHGG